MPDPQETTQGPREVKLKRALTLWHLVIYGIIVIQPTAPMPIFGVVSTEARGHVVTTVLIAMVAMLFTAISYGRMARAYPSAGSAYSYVGHEIHPALGYATGWSMLMDYILNPLICTIWCSKAAGNIAPEIPYVVWAIFFAALFTMLNLRGIRTSARINDVLAAAMGVVIVLFLIQAGRYVLGMPSHPARFFTRPFYDPETFSASALFTGTSIAVLTYIGFDGISTLSEEVENPRRNILLATVLVCLITGALASVEVYAAQLVWPAKAPFPDIDTAYSYVAGRAGGQVLFHLVNFTLLVANIGSGMGAQLGAARLLYGMGRDDAIPKSFFARLDPKRRIPRNSVIFVGMIALAGALLVAISINGHELFSYQLGAELLNFGAFIAFMGVNASSVVHYYFRAEKKRWTHLIPPLLGFGICLFLWVHLRWQAKVAGGLWMLVGIIYGFFKTGGFRKMLSFDVPVE
jgi:putrescine importer